LERSGPGGIFGSCTNTARGALAIRLRSGKHSFSTEVIQMRDKTVGKDKWVQADSSWGRNNQTA